ncbi:MAG: endonuclease domain-containing protein [Nonlabens sp.]|uniref:endonuclease domain-containing protein n=1 Tax=Nonlabens sp. TaxID=1888209 RepID=UPI003EF881AC
MKKLDYLEIEGMFAGATAEVRKFAIHLRANTTESEDKLWGYLKGKPLGFKFRRQHPFNLYVLDFYCHKLKLAIEVDGGYHFKRLQQKKDRARTLDISKYNVEVIRFTNDEILDNYDVVTEKIKTVIEEKQKSKPFPQP